MSGKPCLILGRIVALDQDRLVDPHLGHIEPAVRGVVSDAVGLAGPIAIDQVGGDEVRKGDAGRVTDAEWAFAEFKESVYAIAANFDALIERTVAGRAA